MPSSLNPYPLCPFTDHQERIVEKILRKENFAAFHPKLTKMMGKCFCFVFIASSGIDFQSYDYVVRFNELNLISADHVTSMERILHEDDPLAVVLPVLNHVPETSEELHDSGRDILAMQFQFVHYFIV